MEQVFLSAEWRNLLFLNYKIDPKILQPYLPCHTELDEFEGEYYVSIVGFLFRNVRVKGISFPYHRQFEEANLRFYVKKKYNFEWRRGVVFIKEIVPRKMITLVANFLYGENYRTLPMKHVWHADEDILSVQYQWKLKEKWNHISCKALKVPEDLVPGSREEFITEHYWGFTTINNTCSGMYEVLHPRWKIHKVIDHDLQVNVKDLYGESFTEVLSHSPSSVFLADGSAIKVKGRIKIYQ